MELDRDFKIGMPIWQGDIIGLPNWAEQPPLKQFGLIITADCDIANSDPEEDVVYLRIISQYDYIDLIWAREKLKKIKVTRTRDLTSQIARIRTDKDPQSRKLTADEIEAWITSATAETIISELAPEEKDLEKLTRNISSVREMIDACAATPGTPCLASLCKIKGETEKHVLSQARGELGKMRDELFFVGGITGAEDKTGYYVLLDRIGAIARNKITDSLTEAKNAEDFAYRFGRLAPTFKYAIAQKFAFLFQRIGLPDEHAARHTNFLGNLTVRERE